MPQDKKKPSTGQKPTAKEALKNQVIINGMAKGAKGTKKK